MAEAVAAAAEAAVEVVSEEVRALRGQMPSSNDLPGSSS